MRLDGRPRSCTSPRSARTSNGSGSAGEQITLFILADGLAVSGRPLRRGHEVEITVGDADWIATIDPTTGDSWIDLDVEAQVARWGEAKFSLECPEVWPPVIEARPNESPEPDRAMRALAEAWAHEDEIAKLPLVMRSRVVNEARSI